jgi:hypothetical protein
MKCSANGKGTFEIIEPLQNYLMTYNHATDRMEVTEYAPRERRYVGFGSEGAVNMPKLNVTYHCADGTSYETMVWSATRWFITETEATQQISTDGAKITGDYTVIDENFAGKQTTVYEWEMTALPPE